jgi:ElaB/YqjD/DUF883 family membrane-anchored ribosome-binding protein
MDEATNKMNTTNWNEDDDSYVASESSDGFDENTEQLRADIEDTRAEMSQTINEIQERLSPEHLMGQVKETVREATIGKVERVMDKVADATEPAREAVGRAGTAIKETGMSVADSMWRNPIPVALIGLGLGMLVMRSYRGNGRDYQMRQTTPRRPQNFSGGQTQYGTTTGSLNQVKETASDLANRSTAALSDLGTKAKDSVSTVGTRLSQALRENPLAVGAVAVAAGTAVGLALPSTRLETEYVGKTSEKLVDKAQEVAREAIDKVQNAAQQMGNEGQQPHV